ncbi:hypothetical protein Tco_1047569 [Tanacetum coccineum]
MHLIWALALMAKAFTLNDTTSTNNNQRSSSNPSNMKIAQPGMNVDQDRQMLMVEDIVGNQFRLNAMHNVGNPGVQNVGNHNGLSVVSEIANQHGDVNVVTASRMWFIMPATAQVLVRITEREYANMTTDSVTVHHFENCYDNDIFNMFTQEEHYTELLEPIPEPHQVPQNNSNVISEVSSVEQSGG